MRQGIYRRVGALLIRRDTRQNNPHISVEKSVLLVYNVYQNFLVCNIRKRKRETMKKRISIIIAVFLLAMGITACGNSDVPAKRTKEEIAAFTGKLQFDLPEGFAEAEETDGVTYYCTEDYPEVASNICYSVSEKDSSFDVISAKYFTKKIAAELKKGYDQKVTTTIVEEDFFELDGRRGFMYIAEYQLEEVKIVQMQYILEDAEEFHFITYTEMNDEGFLNAFKESAKTIRFE